MQIGQSHISTGKKELVHTHTHTLYMHFESIAV